VMNARTDLHLARLREHITSAHRPTLEFLEQLTQKFASYGTDAPAMALKTLSGIVHRQGVVMAFGDIFLLLTVMFLLLVPATFVLNRPHIPGAATKSDAH
jgi:MFS transporter, DHA2 family, multidrug resistance protein